MPVEPANFPDLYSDSVSVAAGPYGFALSFLLTDPLNPSAEGELPGQIVARVRLSRELVDALAALLAQSLKNVPEPTLTFRPADAQEEE